MLSRRVIACLDVRDGHLAKSVRFVDTKNIGDPVAKAREYYEDGLDELVFYDITASSERRRIILDVVEAVAAEVFIPLSVGGGVRSVQDATDLRLAGAEKINVNSAAVRRPALIAAECADAIGSQNVVLSMDDIGNLDEILKRRSVTEVDGVLLDLGVSSLQLDSPERGFSFARSGPLDMRMNPDQSLTAKEVVNSSSEKNLAKIFWDFGEERYARNVARRIVQFRRIQPITTTLQLAEIVQAAIPSNARRPRIHNATRVFQALRIYVNDELKRLQLGLNCAVSSLAPGGRICIISFHSLEDRIVKKRFHNLSRTCVCPPQTPICVCCHKPSLHVLTKRPITPQPDEIQKNPRSRSAKLRAAMKIGES